MVTYNPKDWVKLIVKFHKSDTVRILALPMLLLGALTGLICFAEINYLKATVPSLTIFHQISGFIISLVLVFRINTAYDRWWEGRKLWGSLLNNSRSLAVKLSVFMPADDYARESMAHLIGNFAVALKNHLRSRAGTEEIIFTPGVGQAEYISSGHKPNFIAGKLTAASLQVCKSNTHTQNDYLILSTHIAEMIDICGACERIRNTPIPYSYSIFIKKFVFIYVITMPFTFGLSIGYWAIPVVMIMFYAFASLEILSEEIEDPFGTDYNDLPTDDITSRIQTNVKEILLSNGY